MSLRQRFSRDPLKIVKQFDAFPKVPEECQQSSKIGGTRKQLTTFVLLLFSLSINFEFLFFVISVYYQYSFDHLCDLH